MARIAFFHKLLHENLGAMCIAAYLKKSGHECGVFCGDAEKDIVRSILKFEPDIVGSGVTTPEHTYSLEVFGKLKRQDSDIRTIMGAHHATIYPEETISNPEVDIVCLGEGESSVLELMERIDSRRDFSDIQGLWVKRKDAVVKNPLRDLTKDLDTLLFADRELYYSKYSQLADKPTKPFIISRGCPFQCSFCFNHYYQDMFKASKPFVNYRSPENVIAEIKQVKQKYRLDWVQFHDSTFNSNRRYTQDFLEKYKSRGLPGFLCNVRLDLLDEPLVRLMKEAGCNRVTVGIESGDETIRSRVLVKSMTNKQILAGAALLKKYKIRMSTSNIMGLPGETLENAFATIELNREIDPEVCNCHVLMPFPKTRIAQYCIDNGYLDKDFGLDWITGPNQIQTRLKQKNINQLINLQKFFYFAVKYPKMIPLIKVLINLPSNRLFLLIKNQPLLMRSLRYENRLPTKVSLVKKWLSGEDF